MSQAEIGNLRVRLGLDSAEFANGVRNVQGSLSTLASGLKAFAASAAASEIFSATVDAIKAVAEIGDVAESIGITAEQLQAFQKMAIASGTSTDVLTRGLQTIAEQSVTTGSELSKLFEANGLALKGKGVNEIIQNFMELVRNAKDPAEQLAIITGVLGDKVGRQLVEAFREGAGGADKAFKDMVASGNYHTNAEVARLQDLETKYNQTIDRIATYWRKVVVGIVESIDSLNEAGTVGPGMMMTRYGPRPAPQGNGLSQRAPVKPNLGPMGGAGEFNFVPIKITVRPPDKPETEKVKKDIADAVTPPPVDTSGIEDQSAALMRLADETVSYYEQTRTPLEAFQEEVRHINDVLIPGTELYAKAIAQAQDQFAEAAYASNEWAQTLQGSLEDMFGSIIDGSFNARDALRDLASQLAKLAANKLLTSLFMSFFKPSIPTGGFQGFYADGGTLGAGQWGIAGEAGPEIVKGPASIIPMDSSGSGGVTVIMNNDFRGADGGTVARLEAQMQTMTKTLEKNVLSIVQNQKNKNPRFAA